MSLSGCCSATLSTIGEWILNSDQWDRSVGEPDTTHRKPWVRLLHNINHYFYHIVSVFYMLLIFSTIILWFDEFSDEHELKPVIAKLISFVSRFFAVAMFMKNPNITAPWIWMVRHSVELACSTLETVVFRSSMSEVKSEGLLIVFFILLWYPPIIVFLHSCYELVSEIWTELE